ncbi:MAG TPA: hypothetical protein VFZ66_18615 [Herpetosiphonaceae bacterium]
MDTNIVRTRFRTEVQALVRLYHAMEGSAIGLASVSLDGLDQSWRDRVQRIRALPREAPRRKHMIEALVNLLEQTLWKQRANLEKLQEIDAALAAEALTIARRGEATEETPSQSA